MGSTRRCLGLSGCQQSWGTAARAACMYPMYPASSMLLPHYTEGDRTLNEGETLVTSVKEDGGASGVMERGWSTPWLRCDPSIWISQSACVPTTGEAGSRLNRRGRFARLQKCQRAGEPPHSRSPGSWVPTIRDPAGSFVPTHHSSLMNRLTDTTVSRVLYLASMYPMYPASSMLLPRLSHRHTVSWHK